MTVLEDENQRAKGGAESEQVHQHGFDRQNHGAGHKEKDRQRGNGHDQHRKWQGFKNSALQIEELCGQASDLHRKRRV